jgi:hypothetical protein
MEVVNLVSDNTCGHSRFATAFEINGDIFRGDTFSLMVDSKVEGRAVCHHANLVAQVSYLLFLCVCPRRQVIKRRDLRPSDRAQSLDGMVEPIWRRFFFRVNELGLDLRLVFLQILPE